MTEKQFTRYLFEWLFESAEDVCSKCANCPKDGNACLIDSEYNTCLKGLKEYADKNSLTK